jgi:uncharacterized protein
MQPMIFVNLAVADVAASTAFYEAIGFEKDPRFSNESGSAMKWSDTIYFMILAKPLFSTFTAREIIDATTSTEALFALSFDSREAVDAIVERAANAGGKIDAQPPEDLGFMYSRDFTDLDGHGFGPFYMDAQSA